MMSGLVADYGSDNSDFTDSDEDYQSSKVANILNEDIDVPGISKPIDDLPKVLDVSDKKAANVVDPLAVAADASSSSNSSSDEDSPKDNDEPQMRLPNPIAGVFHRSDDTKLQSVFSTEYDHREQAKRSVLEKHVKLTDDEIEKERNRPLCKKFLKGKCRFGVRCKFRHDTNVESQNPVVTQAASFSHSPVVLESGHRLEYTPDQVDEDAYGADGKRKRRYGVRDSLQPPKKALKDLNKHRQKDRPWTMN